DWRELRRPGWAMRDRMKLALLRFTQSRGFRRSQGIIFLSRFAQETVLSATGPLGGACTVIPHGIGSRFLTDPRRQLPIDHFSDGRPFMLLYVSMVYPYKHPWHLVDAVARVRQRTGWPVAVDLVGPAYRPALKRLLDALHRFDPDGAWARYRGEVPHH